MGIGGSVGQNVNISGVNWGKQDNKELMVIIYLKGAHTELELASI